MPVVTFVGLADEAAVEARLAGPTLVTGDEKNGMPAWIEGEGQPPHATSRLEAKLLHVGVPGALQGVHPWATQSRPKRFEQKHESKNFIPDRKVECVELVLKIGMKLDDPSHTPTMLSKTYAFKPISR